MEQERRDPLHRVTIEHPVPCILPSDQMENADYHRRVTGPLDPLGGAVDLAAVLADPSQSGGPRIALSDGVGGDQAQRATIANQTERTPVEVCHEVGITVALLMHLLEPAWIAIDVSRRDAVLPGEWRVANESVEARVLALEHLGKLDLPVEWSERHLSVAPFLHLHRMAPGFAIQDRLLVRPTSRFPLFRLGALEERGQHQIAEQPHVDEGVLSVAPEVLQPAFGDGLVRLANLAP